MPSQSDDGEVCTRVSNSADSVFAARSSSGILSAFGLLLLGSSQQCRAAVETILGPTLGGLVILGHGVSRGSTTHGCLNCRNNDSEIFAERREVAGIEGE